MRRRIPPGIRHLGGDPGHCDLYTWDDNHFARHAGHLAPPYTNPEFLRPPATASSSRRNRHREAEPEARAARGERERAQRAKTSDVTAHTLEPYKPAEKPLPPHQ